MNLAKSTLVLAVLVGSLRADVVVSPGDPKIEIDESGGSGTGGSPPTAQPCAAALLSNSSRWQ
jgi:hypothetical protein